MKAMMLTGIRQMAMTDVPDPVIKNPKDVKIRDDGAGDLRIGYSLLYTGEDRFPAGQISVYSRT